MILIMITIIVKNYRVLSSLVFCNLAVKFSMLSQRLLLISYLFSWSRRSAMIMITELVSDFASCCCTRKYLAG